MKQQAAQNERVERNSNLQKFKSKLPKLQLKRNPQQSHKDISDNSELLHDEKKPKKPAKSLEHLSDTITDKSFEDYFSVTSKIGEGAHAVVYKCLEKTGKKIYAVKILKRNDPQLVEGMRGCYQIMKVLDHKYVMKPRYMFIQNKTSGCQIVTEYYDYGDLRQYMNKIIPKYNSFDEPQAAEIIHKILMAVSYMHEKMVCHRDLKPDNILYNDFNGQIKVLDFEIARMQRYKHQKLDLWTDTGSIYYRAPESFKGGYSYSIDVWAVGVISYEMLTGEIPFKSTYVSDIREKIRSEELNFEELSISKLAKQFLQKLLCKSPDHRISAEKALSHPFLLKHLKANLDTCTSPMNSSFDQAKNEEQYDEKKESFYDDETMDNFLGCISKSDDIIVNPE